MAVGVEIVSNTATPGPAQRATSVRQLTSADFVLVIASPMCKRVGDGRALAEDNRDLQSELPLIQEFLQGNPATWHAKILPVVLPGCSADEIPEFLQPETADHYEVTNLTVAGAEDLLRILIASSPEISPPTPAADKPAPRLTRRERQVLQFIAKGYSNNAIAEGLAISRGSAARQVASIRGKLGLISRIQI